MAQINQPLCCSQHGELSSVAEERGNYEGDAKRLGRKVNSVHFLVSAGGPSRRLRPLERYQDERATKSAHSRQPDRTAEAGGMQFVAGCRGK